MNQNKTKSQVSDRMSAFYNNPRLSQAEQSGLNLYVLRKWTGRSISYFVRTNQRLCFSGQLFPVKGLDVDLDKLDPNKSYFISFRAGKSRAIALVMEKLS